MFWSTGNHWGLQEDTHYCPNVTCWCVNCQHICMQKLYQFPVCFIYEESLQIDMSTGPNAVDVSTVSLMHLWTVPSLLHIWREHTDRPVNLSQCWWCVNCQHICQQKMRLWTVPSCFIYEQSIYAERHVNLSQCCCCVNCQQTSWHFFVHTCSLHVGSKRLDGAVTLLQDSNLWPDVWYLCWYLS